MSLAAGTKLGPYEILSVLGAGGMGEVYRARDPRLGRDVAVKVLPEAFAEDRDRLARFEREAKAIAALSHPNILAVFDTGTADRGSDRTPARATYVVTELLEGETLRDRLKDGALPPRRAVEIGTQIANGLAAAHEKGLVHRDLKPENVFVTTDGRVKILDFGLARPITLAAPTDDATVLGSGNATTPGLIVGTIGYMAPEQVRGEVVDARTDIFAFGAVMYELLTGERAFRGATPADTLSAILKEDPADARTRDGVLPPTLERLLLRCLEKAPGRRFQSTQDLAFALEHALGSSAGPMPAPRGLAPGQARAQDATARRYVGGLALLGTGLLVGGILIGRLWRPAAPTAMQPTFTALTMDSGLESWPSLSGDGTSLLYVSHAAGHDDIYLRRAAGRNAINLTAESSSDNTMPAFSPDDRRIAFRSERQGGGLFVMEATGENVKRVSDQGYNPAWSPDGEWLAFATEATVNPMSRNTISQLWVVNLASGAKRKITDTDAMQPSWSPDGRRLAVWSVQGGQRTLQIVVADSGAAAPVFPSDPSITYWNPVWSPDGRWLYFASNGSGAMTLGRAPVDASGHLTGPRETLVAPSVWVGQIALSRDGRRLAYQALSIRYGLWRASFDTSRASPASPPPFLPARSVSAARRCRRTAGRSRSATRARSPAMKTSSRSIETVDTCVN